MPTLRFLALLACTVAVCLGLAEGLSRLHYEDRQRKDFAAHTTIGYDPVLGWAGIPGVNVVDGFGAHHSINADGLRDDDWTAKLAEVIPGRTRTILLLGDSLTYGLCISKRDRLGEQLEALYRQNGGCAVVFNTGIPGYGPDQELLALRRHLPRVKPDVVAVYFCVNDFGDAALPYDHREPYRRCYKPYFDADGRPALNTPPVPVRFSQRVKGLWMDSWRMKYLVDDLQGLFDDLRYRLAGVSENRRISGADGPAANMDSIMFDPRFDDLYQANKQRLFSLYARMRDECRAAGARFVVLSNHGRSSPHEKEFHDSLAAMGIQSVSTFEQDRTPFDRTYFCAVRGDGHPNYLQNAVNAQVLYNALENASVSFAPDQAAWYAAVPRMLQFGRTDINPYIFGSTWHVSETTGRWFDKQAGCLIRGESSDGTQRLRLDFLSARAGEFHIAVNAVDHAVAVPASGRYSLVLPLPAAPLYALGFSADAFIGDDISHNGDMRSLSYFLMGAAVVAGDAGPDQPTLERLP